MRRICAVTVSLVLGALIANTPQLAFGQDEETIPVLVIKARTGTEIQGDAFGEFIGKNLSVRFWTDMRPLSVKLRLEMILRDEGVIEKYESEAVEVKGGESYPGSKWVTQKDRHEIGFGEDLKFTIVGVVVINHEEQYIPRECKDATHAVRMMLVSDSRLSWEPNKSIDFICLRVEG